MATRNMFPDEGRSCVCDVFDEAIEDMAPFVKDDGRFDSFLKGGFGRGSSSSSYSGTSRLQEDFDTSNPPSDR